MLHHFAQRTGLLALLITAVALLSASSADAVVPNGTYVIGTGNTISSKVWGVGGGSTANGAKVQQFRRDGRLNQQWKIARADTSAFGDRLYIFKPKHATNKCLDVPGGSQAFGVDLHLFDCHFRENQLFLIIPVPGSSSFRIVAYHSLLTLEVENGSGADGAPIQQGPLGTPIPARQQFQLQRIAG